jgi:hypothetical protein
MKRGILRTGDDTGASGANSRSDFEREMYAARLARLSSCIPMSMLAFVPGLGLLILMVLPTRRVPAS